MSKVAFVKAMVSARQALISHDSSALLDLLCLLPDHEIHYEIYLNTLRNWFLHEERTSLSDLMRVAHRIKDDYFSYFSNQYELSHLYSTPDLSSYDIILFTAQVLTIQHGPTLTTLSMAKSFSALGYSVLIVDLNSLYHQNKFKLFIGGKIKEYERSDVCISLLKFGFDLSESSGGSSIVYDGEQYDYYDLNGSIDEKMIFVLRAYQKASLGSIFIGDTFFVDLASRLGCSKVISFMCSTTLPCVFNAKSFIARRISEHDKELNPNVTNMIEIDFPYCIRVGDIIKSDAPHPEIRFVLVGSRLNDEIDNCTIDLINAIARRWSGAEFHFYGCIVDDRLIEKMPNARILSHGMEMDLNVIYGDKDFYINPMRNGGGTSAFEAMKYDIPVLTRKYGDVYHTVGDLTAFDSNDEIVLFIDSYLKNKLVDLYRDRLEMIDGFSHVASLSISYFLSNENKK